MGEERVGEWGRSKGGDTLPATVALISLDHHIHHYKLKPFQNKIIT